MARLASGVEEFRAAVRDEIKCGADVIKVYVTGGHGNVETGTTELSADELEVLVSTAHQRGRKVRAHCAWKRELMQCLELGVDIIDHGDALDGESIEAMLEAGTTLVPSAWYLEKLLADPALGGPGTAPLTGATERELENLQRRVPEANAAGVRIVLGDDYGIDFLPHGTYAEELQFYVKRVGIAPLDVIRWATVNGAAVMGQQHELGAVREGYLADLLVVDGDPTTDISVLQDASRLRGIMKDGVFVKDALEGGTAAIKGATK